MVGCMDGIRRSNCAAMQGIVAMGMFAICAGRAYGGQTMRVVIDPGVKYQRFEGFGQGHMGQHMPGWYTKYPAVVREKILDQLYSMDANSLGLRICRFCVPVGDAPGHDHMRRIPAVGNIAFEPEDGKFRWGGHEADLWYLQGAKRRGAVMYASWYGVPYWMSVSGCSAGSADGNSPNLKAGKEERFARHICDVLKHFKEEWGIEFEYVGAINEPDADWWKAGGPQPGCAVAPAQAAAIYKSLKGMLPGYGLKPELVAHDSAYLNTDWYVQEILKGPAGGDIAVIAAHQYITSADGITQWRQAARQSGKQLWMSEWGDWENAQGGDNKPYEQAMKYADKIHEAFESLRANAWIMWEPRFIFDEKEDGLVPRKAYWMVAQYSRFVRPGMRMVEASQADPNLKTTAWASGDGTLVIVTVNDREIETQVSYDVSRAGGMKVKEIRRTSRTEDLADRTTVAKLEGGRLVMDVPAGSVTTILLAK
jgi:O-glycosyl hydrolase